MGENKKFYLTTTLPYVNADPHIGFALEAVQADAVARYRRIFGDEVVFNTGTDEHGVKIYRKALEEGKDPQSYVDKYAARFGDLKQALDLSFDRFIRTTDPKHMAAAQEFWRRCAKNGDIEKKTYKVKYCVGCELEKTDSELVDGCCPIHPNLELETIEEENYFFKFSNYGGKLASFYEAHPDFVVPDYRFNEIKAFVGRGLADFSISRLRSKMPWGVPVPGDEDQIMYVWFDALVNYISTLGWPEDENMGGFWPGIQFAGKDNLRQQSAMWQAMLMSAGIDPSKQIIIHGFITSGGEKMSKSLGNVVDPFALVSEFGTDALRYYLLRGVHPFEDSDFTADKFKDAYNGGLANGLGNLVSRILKMAMDNEAWPEKPEKPDWSKVAGTPLEDIGQAMEKYRFDGAMSAIWSMIGDLDARIQNEKPFKLVKEDPDKGRQIVREMAGKLYEIGCVLEPFLPGTSAKIISSIEKREMPAPLFMRV